MSAATKTNGRTPRVLAAASTVQPDPGGLMDALLKVAAQAPKLTRNADGQVGGRTYKYVDLDSLLDAIMPLLVEHELVWMAKPTMQDGAPALRYRLTHVPSGECEEDVMPLMGATDSQGVGSALTYARRYALLAVLNLAPGEDDDGAAASNLATFRQQTPTVANQPVDKYADTAQGQPSVNTGSAQPTAAPPKPSERQLSEAQKRLLSVRSKDLTPAQFAHVLAVAKGVQPPDEPDAKRWVDREVDRLPARLVDAVLEGIASCPPY